MAKKIEYGFRNVYYSVITEGVGGSISYGTPKSFLAQGAGGISVNLAPSGDQVDFYADDVSWYNQATNNGYDGDLVMTKVSDEFKKDVLGMIEDVNGALIEKADAIFKGFALGFEVQGNDAPTRTWYYNCTVARPSEEHNTKDATITPAEKTLTLSVRPRATDNKVKVSMTKNSTNETAYNGFFSAVYEEQQASI